MRQLLGTNDVLAYLVMMTARLVELHRVLKPTGSLYLHCDPTASHYLKILLDAVFGSKNFRNEIVWHYTGGGRSKTYFSKKHDVIFWYSNGSSWTFNVDAIRVPYKETSGYAKSGIVSKAGKQYRPNPLGTPVDDVWDIPIINPLSKERLGYPTQKPLVLLERIIVASSNEGDIVLDPFCGCGTTVDAAHKLNRCWIGIDITYLAIDLIRKRLRHTYGDDIETSYEVMGIPRDLDGARALFSANHFDFERWAVSLIDAQPKEKQGGDKGIDGVARFHVDFTRIGQVLVSVKGGRQLNPAMVRDLVGTVQRTKAEMGVLITLAEPTRGMVEEANASGSYLNEITGTSYPKVQIVTTADLLAGRLPKMPTPILPYVKAKPWGGDQFSMI